MEKIYIREERQRGYLHYSFKPVGFIKGFYERSGTVVGIGFDRKLGRWTAPGREETTMALRREFGDQSLIWQGADTKENAEGTRTPRRASFDQRRPNEVKSATWSLAPGKSLSLRWRNALHSTEEQLRAKRYSWRTVKSYLYHLRQFFAAHPDMGTNQITEGVIRSYIVKRVKHGNYAESTQGQMLNAIKFWLERVEGREKAFVDLRPKKREQLPTVLSVPEVRRLFQAVNNIKHRCILKIIYGGGLRLSEVTNLRVADIHSDRLLIFVHGGKGKKDRYTTLSGKFLEELRTYFREYRPTYWLFEGQTGGQYSVRSVQAVLRKAVKRSGVNPYCTVHTLRHSYATHLLEAGTSLRHIQELLGHANSTTTELYTRVSTAEKQRVISPLDRLE